MHYSMVTVRSATARLAVVGVVAASMALGVGYTAAAAPAPGPSTATVTPCKSYWPSPYVVCGDIRDLYDSLGGATGSLSFPTGSASAAPDGIGTRQQFANGAIYSSPAGTHVE